ncbi:TerC family protein [Luteolibacter sp. SL250]|uniref:TerC family protein n=1 Tax=Luteolibacter sp. SL250 TaxID=2995170 RepID=UPI0022716D89|nr:TerC family protein [Luteolibacter sp. SL250]WAC17974.1 TerC family protein [Luteolibacter sp. SL250]
MFDWFNDPTAWAALLTLTLLEIVLGIDNIVFISILVDRLPESMRKKARFIGLALAMIMRLLLLFTLKWIMGLVDPVFHIPIHPALHDPLFGPDVTTKLIASAGMLGISIKDLILLGGGFFLIWKSTKEIHHKFEGDEESAGSIKKAASFGAVLVQIALIDIIFSLDSVITAVGMAKDLSVMALAVIISVAVMMLSSGAISAFVSKHPSVKMLALSFLILIGTALMAEGLHFHIPKGYIYFAMAFSLGVEMLNLKLRSKGGSTPSPNI